MESKTEGTTWKSIKNYIRNWCQKWCCILFGVIYRENKQWLAVGRLPVMITKEKDLPTVMKEICCGLREHQHSEMAGLNLNLRAFLLKCIEPKSALRATTSMLLGDQWLTKHGLHRMAELPEDILSDKERHWVASTIKDGLKTNCSTDTILKHLKNRPFNTTGGMFNLLSIELLQS